MSKEDDSWEGEHGDSDRTPARFLLPLLQEVGAQEGEEAHPPGTAPQTPPTAAWVRAHLLRQQPSCKSPPGTAARL